MSGKTEKKMAQGISTGVKLLTRLIVWGGCFVLIFGGLYWQRDAVARYALLTYLHKNGFAAARIQDIDVEMTTVSITGFKLSEDLRIDGLHAGFHWTPGDDYPVFVDKLVLKGLSYQEQDLPESAGDTDLPILLREVFSLAQQLPLAHVELDGADITLQPRNRYLPQQATISKAVTNLRNISDTIDFQTDILAKNGKSTIGAVLRGILFQNGDAAVSLVLHENSLLHHPLADLSNIGGDADIRFKNGQIVAEKVAVTIGAARLLSIPLENMTLSYAETDTEKLLSAAGKSPGSTAEFSMKINIKSTGEVSGKTEISAESLGNLYKSSRESFAAFKQLSAFEEDLKNIKGSLNLALDFSGKKTAAKPHTDFAAWQDFSGFLQVTAKALSLPPHLHNTNADIRLHLSRNAEGIMALPENFNADGQTGRNKTAFKLAIDPKPDTTHLLMDNAGVTLNIRLPRLQLSYGNILEYNGGLSGTVNRADTAFALTEASGLLKLPAHDITIDLYEAVVSGGYGAKAQTKADLKTAVTLPDNIMPALRADTELVYDAENGKLRFASKLRDQANHANAQVTGFVRPATQKGEINIEMPPVQFTPSGTQPHHLSPLLAGLLQKTSGSAGFSATLSLPELRGTAQLLLKNLSAEIAGKPVTNLNAALEIRNLIPPVLEKQTVAVESFNPGIPFFGGLVTLSYDAAQARPLTVHNAEWQMAGGTVSFANVRLDPAKPDTAFPVTVRELSLQQLLQYAKVDGLYADGLISGSLPLRLRGDDIFIENGVISTTAPGVVQYAPKDLPAFLQNGNPNMDFVRNVISNFHYESLRFLLNGKAGGEQTIRLEAKGRNPDMAETRPVALNLNLEGALENIFQHHVQAYTIPDNIREKIRQYEEKHVPLP